MHWVLILFISGNYSGEAGVTQVAGFTSQQACVEQIDWLKRRNYAQQAFCVYVK